MALALNLYDIFRRKQMSGNGSVNMNSLTVKVMIVTSSYIPNQNTHDFRDDLGATEVTGTNYTAGGNTLANPVIALDGSGNASIDFDDPAAWLQSGSGFSTGRRYIFYIARGGLASADELIGYSDDPGADFGNTITDHVLQLPAAGLITSAR